MDVSLLIRAKLLLVYFKFFCSQVFFGFHLIGAATIHIIILTILVYITGVLFYRVDQVAGVLIIPYAAWLTFATSLSIAIWRLN